MVQCVVPNGEEGTAMVSITENGYNLQRSSSVSFKCDALFFRQILNIVIFLGLHNSMPSKPAMPGYIYIIMIFGGIIT
jgi:hypothetical protein